MIINLSDYEICKLTDGSHKLIDVVCDYNITDKCRGEFKKEFRTVVRDREKNNGKDICLYCSRKLKYSGRDNPNAQYQIDDNYFVEIDNEIKSYILGLIASDGSVRDGMVSISLNQRDIDILGRIRDLLDKDLSLKPRPHNMITLNLCSQKMSHDICKHLNIGFGKKSHTVKMPRFTNDDLRWAFIRGYFDGDGSVSDPNKNQKRYPVCNITTSSKYMLEQMDSEINIPHYTGEDKIEFSHNAAIDFLSKIYDNATIYMHRKRDLYIDWSCWVPSLSGRGSYGSEMLFRWNKSRKDAVAPFKSNSTDAGYDLTVLDKVKQVGKIEFYDTGIKVLPEFGWYFDLVPRSSLVKYGYMLANSVGIIDRTYTGNILVPLVKIDDSLPDISFGSRIVQIIPRPIVHVQFEEVDELDQTNRGAGGFGSTGPE